MSIALPSQTFPLIFKFYPSYDGLSKLNMMPWPFHRHHIPFQLLNFTFSQHRWSIWLTSPDVQHSHQKCHFCSLAWRKHPGTLFWFIFLYLRPLGFCACLSSFHFFPLFNFRDWAKINQRNLSAIGLVIFFSFCIFLKVVPPFFQTNRTRCIEIGCCHVL